MLFPSPSWAFSFIRRKHISKGWKYFKKFWIQSVKILTFSTILNEIAPESQWNRSYYHYSVFSQKNGTLTLAFELSKEMLVILLSSYENSSKWWILRLAEQRNGEYFAQLEVRLHPLNHKLRFSGESLPFPAMTVVISSHVAPLSLLTRARRSTHPASNKQSLREFDRYDVKNNNAWMQPPSAVPKSKIYSS